MCTPIIDPVLPEDNVARGASLLFIVRLFSPLRIYQKVIVNNGLCEGRLLRCLVNLEALLVLTNSSTIALLGRIDFYTGHLSTLCLHGLIGLINDGERMSIFVCLFIQDYIGLR